MSLIVCSYPAGIGALAWREEGSGRDLGRLWVLGGSVFSFAEGSWYILKSSGGFEVHKFGTSTDLPVPGDYDEVGKTDLVVWRAGPGSWYGLLSGGGIVVQPSGAGLRCP